ncbi:MAG: type II toxin-antitoxin system RelE/ParE family toxin [Micropepsaceae bacterium]
MRLVYLPSATDDLDRLYNFLAPKNEPAAAAALRTIRDAADSLADGSPERGTPIGYSGYRQLFVRFGRSAYVIRYRIGKDEDGDNVTVVRVWHGRERRN